jgi:hypothetical protein
MLSTPSAMRSSRPSNRQLEETWHRMKCRLRRHQMVVGSMVQVGGEGVWLERNLRLVRAAETAG